jgi:hypothetical protein
LLSAAPNSHQSPCGSRPRRVRRTFTSATLMPGARGAARALADVLESLGDGVCLVDLAPAHAPLTLLHAVAIIRRCRDRAGRATLDTIASLVNGCSQRLG